MGAEKFQDDSDVRSTGFSLSSRVRSTGFSLSSRQAKACTPNTNARTPYALLLRLHQNDRGAIAFLVLLTIWCLISLFAMTWNTAEYGYRRQHLQAAADTAAHSATVWTSRALNAVTAQNMIIDMDAATQTIWEAVPIADKSLNDRLNNELNRIEQLRNGAQQRRNQIQKLIQDAALEHQLAVEALNNVNANVGEASFPDAQTATDFSKQVRQAISALGWVDDTYMNGDPPTNGRPGPPANGQGLIPFSNQFVQQKIEEQILDLIENYINETEFPVVRDFESQTAPATSQPVDQQAQQHEQQVFQSQQQIIDGVSAAVEDQRQKLATFDKANVTLATWDNDGSSSGPATVEAPIVQAADVDASVGQGITDSIRENHPAEAAAAGLSPVVDVDPINPQTEDARIWYPDVPLMVPGLAKPFTLKCNVPGGWGHVYAMPIEKFFQERVDMDKSRIDADFMRKLDQLRQQLKTLIEEKLGLPDTDVTPLPGSIVDDQPDAKGVIEKIPILPHLSSPPKASSKFESQVDTYNLVSGRYLSDVNRLRQLVGPSNYIYFYEPFASDAWNSAVDTAREDVLEQLGTAKTFMVLKTYKLQFLEDGQVKESLRGSAQAAVKAQIIATNAPILMSQLIRVNKGVAPTAAALAASLEVMEDKAGEVAQEIADEWVARPWPYEIQPPKDSDPQPRGMGDDDRIQYFTVIAAAEQTDGSTPKLLLPSMFGTQPKLVAYAQAESFNWMEFNNAYGGSQRTDQVSYMPAYGLRYTSQLPIAVPRCWRLATVGGWNWQPRLSVSDALPQMWNNNPELLTYMNDAGITANNDDAATSDLQTINLH